jgi:hypothetical protein
MFENKSSIFNLQKLNYFFSTKTKIKILIDQSINTTNIFIASDSYSYYDLPIYSVIALNHEIEGNIMKK